jgi:acyl carrier protein
VFATLQGRPAITTADFRPPAPLPGIGGPPIGLVDDAAQHVATRLNFHMSVRAPEFRGRRVVRCSKARFPMDDLSVRRLIAEHLGVAPGQVIDNALFQQDLGADSLDLIELTMLLENEFGIDIPDGSSELCLTVGEALDSLRPLMSPAQEPALVS